MLALDNRKTQVFIKGKLMNRTAYFQRGMTLIELLIVLIIVGILVGFVAPSFNSLLMGSKVRGTTEDVLSALSAARAEAVTRKQSISLCRSQDGTACSGVGDWKDGFIMYVDTENETSGNTAPETILRHWSSLPRDSLISLGRGGVGVGFVRFTRMGTLARVDNSPAVFLIKVQNCGSTDNQRRISVALSGIPTMTREMCSE